MKHILRFLLLVVGFCVYAQPATDEGMTFSGVNSFNAIPDSDYINTNSNPVSNRTIELAFKADSVGARQVLYEEGGASNAFVIYIESGFIYVGLYRNKGDELDEAIFFRESINANTWYHVAMVLAGGNVFSWYLDGVFKGSDIEAFSIPRHTGDITLGMSSTKLRYANCGTWVNNKCQDSTTEENVRNYFAGIIWGFRIWNSVRTQTEINANKGIIISNEMNSDLVAYMPSTYDIVRFKGTNGIFQDAFSTNTTVTLSVKNYNYLAKDVYVVSKNKILYINSNLTNAIEKLAIYDVTGKKCKQATFNPQLNVYNLSAGAYFIIFTLDNFVQFSKKVIVQ